MIQLMGTDVPDLLAVELTGAARSATRAFLLGGRQLCCHIGPFFGGHRTRPLPAEPAVLLQVSGISVPVALGV